MNYVTAIGTIGIGCECATEQGNGVELNLVNVNQVVVKKKYRKDDMIALQRFFQSILMGHELWMLVSILFSIIEKHHCRCGAFDDAIIKPIAKGRKKK